DVCELRLDRLGRVPDAEIIRSLAMPWIATVRDPSEGGGLGLDETQRAALFHECVGRASAIDVELENATARQELIREIEASNSSLILSFHDFQSAPDLKSARALMRRAVDGGADVFKLAVTPQRPSEIGNLLELLDDPCIPVSLMAMGRWGLAARLLCAACGSLLNYGWVEEAVVSGQWEATELKKQLDRVTSTELTRGG
ncbi:MAG: type I 3-dehydroquinate dehydratase, partial [Chthoniobacterales bacterium]